MKFIRNYFHEIYSVITVLWITLSAIFVNPEFTQKLVLAYAFLFLLHEWEECNYPGGFFDMLFGEAVKLDPVPTGDKLKKARVNVYLMLMAFTFPAYFLPQYTWLILPITYLGIIEGVCHTMIIKVFKLNRRYTPGMVTALCQFAFSIFTFYLLIKDNLVKPWQYIAGLFICLLGFYLMGRRGLAANGVSIHDLPKIAKARLKEVHGK